MWIMKKWIKTLVQPMTVALLTVSVGMAIIAAGVATMPAAATTVPVSIPSPTPSEPEWMYIPYCEDTDGAGPCAMWDDQTDGAPAQWWVQPMLPLGQVYPQGAVSVPECKDGLGTGAPCVWPGEYGDPTGDRGSDLHAVVFGG